MWFRTTQLTLRSHVSTVSRGWQASHQTSKCYSSSYDAKVNHIIDLLFRDTSEVDGAWLSPSEIAARIPTKSPDGKDAASFCSTCTGENGEDLPHVSADAPSFPALPSNGKVFIVESLLPVAPKNIASSHIVFEQDLFMLAQNPGGKERTTKEFEALAKNSVFSGCEIICCAYNIWVMECHRKSTAKN
ncbi:hypothetical protein SADUNF_Sadunf05G0133200 [Salix dunnii]|uniref:O-methyltransferase C-terminal domain-containing protein n=1 Tax=Salix dunnii TaxID=1413687 RepID=A0A835N3P1_9ROSI|nr:hypothetical protein SADUNF_Sadunf05G0133200 [Salix dunnii]